MLALEGVGAGVGKPAHVVLHGAQVGLARVDLAQVGSGAAGGLSIGAHVGDHGVEQVGNVAAQGIVGAGGAAGGDGEERGRRSRGHAAQQQHGGQQDRNELFHVGFHLSR